MNEPGVQSSVSPLADPALTLWVAQPRKQRVLLPLMSQDRMSSGTSAPMASSVVMVPVIVSTQPCWLSNLYSTS